MPATEKAGQKRYGYEQVERHDFGSMGSSCFVPASAARRELLRGALSSSITTLHAGESRSSNWPDLVAQKNAAIAAHNNTRPSGINKYKILKPAPHLPGMQHPAIPHRLYLASHHLADAEH